MEYIYCDTYDKLCPDRQIKQEKLRNLLTLSLTANSVMEELRRGRSKDKFPLNGRFIHQLKQMDRSAKIEKFQRMLPKSLHE